MWCYYELLASHRIIVLFVFPARVFGTSMVEEYEEIADPPERPDDQDDDLGENRERPPADAIGAIWRTNEPLHAFTPSLTLLPTDYPPGYAPGEAKLSNNLIGSATGGRQTLSRIQPAPLLTFWSLVHFFSSDVIMNMVNNIAVNVLGGGPEIQGEVVICVNCDHFYLSS